MDEQTALVLALQLVALFSIAGALLLYLLCKIRSGNAPDTSGNYPGAGKAILITSADNSFGLQIAVHLADRGFRVFAGLKDGAFCGTPGDSLPARVIRGWQKERESEKKGQGALVALPLDVTREDLMHEGVDIIRAHLPAGEDGIWAVVNTSGASFRGPLTQQDITHWECILKTNIIGTLRTARTFQPLLRNTAGRLINIGTPPGPESGLVAYTASRYAVEGANEALRQEFGGLGIKVVTLHIGGVPPEVLHALAKPKTGSEQGDVSVDLGGCVEFGPRVLSEDALGVLDVALTVREPKNAYILGPPKRWYNCKPFTYVF